MTSSEDVLLQVGQVRYKKGDGTLYVMNERLAWMMDHRDTVSVSHRYADIKMQKISPDGKPKIQLQVVLHDGSASTFQFVNKIGHDNQIKERDDVKQLLQQLLIKFKREVNKELEEKNRMLSENPAMLQLYKDLVITQVISADEFWTHHATQFTKQLQGTAQQPIGVTGAFLADIKPQTDGCNGLRYNLTSDIIECIFKTYPAVRKKHRDQVPHKVTEGDFWTKFFQSHYFHRDRINTGTKDIFTECAKFDEMEMKRDINAGISDPLVDLSTFDEKFLDEGYGTSIEKPSRSIGNQVHQGMIKRFNQHSIMVMKSTSNNSTNTLDASHSNTVCNGAIKENNATSIDAKAKRPHEQTVSNNHILAHPNKRKRLQEAINFDDLISPSVPDEATSNNLNLSKCDRYLHGPLLQSASDDSKSDEVNVRREMKLWNGCRTMRGAAFVSPASAVSALGELTPGGALMKGFHENSIAQMVHKETRRELTNLYLASSELLRHFWASFPPTTQSLEDKAVRIHEALHRFNTAQLKPFEDRLTRDFSPISLQLTSHLNQMLTYAFRKFITWQERQTQSR